MKKLSLTKRDLALLASLVISMLLLLAGVFLKSLLVIAGVTGLVVAWFISIDHLIANHNMNIIKRVLFGGIIIFLPLLFAVYLKA